MYTITSFQNWKISLSILTADITPVGAWPLANPDLVERLKLNDPMNEPDKATFYGGDSHGYTDYPTIDGKSIQNR